MKVEQKFAEGLHHIYEITVPAELIEEKIHFYLNSYKNGAQISGFRPGKVPPALIEARYGKKAQESALAAVIEESNEQLLQEQGCTQVGTPKLTMVSFARGKELVYTYELDVLPELKITSFADIAVEKLLFEEVKEEEIAKALQVLSQTITKKEVPLKAPRPLKDDDKILFKLTTKVGNKAVKGFTEIVCERSLKEEEPFVFPELDETLKAVQLEGKYEVPHQIPLNFSAKNLRGKAALSSIEVLEVLENVDIESLNDLANYLGYEDEASLKETIKENLQKHYKVFTNALLKRRILDALALQYNFELPSIMIEREFTIIWRKLQQELDLAREQGELIEDEAEEEFTEEELKQQYREIAARRVRLGLVIAEIGRLHNISLSADEAKAIILKEAKRHKGIEEEVLHFYVNNPQAYESLMAPHLEDKVISFIASQANITEKIVDFATFKAAVKEVLPLAFENDSLEVGLDLEAEAAAEELLLAEAAPSELPSETLVLEETAAQKSPVELEPNSQRKKSEGKKSEGKKSEGKKR